MAVPTSYTAEDFGTYLLGRLGHTATGLGWATGANGGDFEEVINDTLIQMGLTDIANVTAARIPELRALAQVHLWTAVAESVAGDFDFSADGASYSRSQLQEHAQAMLEKAETRAMQYDPSYQVTGHPAKYHRDPYADHDDHLTDHIDEVQESLRS